MLISDAAPTVIMMKARAAKKIGAEFMAYYNLRQEISLDLMRKEIQFITN